MIQKLRTMFLFLKKMVSDAQNEKIQIKNVEPSKMIKKNVYFRFSELSSLSIRTRILSHQVPDVNTCDSYQ